MISTDLKTSDISIIIPTLNEAGNLAALKTSLSGQAGEVIIVDGGSSDDTVSTAKKLGFRVEKAPAGRAHQLNYGAACAAGKVLIFLHADTRLPAGFAEPVLQTLAREDVAAGAFALAIDEAGPALGWVTFWANLRSRLLQLPYGDQAIFILKERFHRLGGFPPLAIMEDFCFIRKAKGDGKILTLREVAVTSARRWKRLGIVRTTIINQLVILGYLLGVSPERLRSLYRR